MKDHIKGYHEGKRFPCTERDCGIRLSSRRKFILHLKTKHPSSTIPALLDEQQNSIARTVKERAPRSDRGKTKMCMALALSGYSTGGYKNDKQTIPKQECDGHAIKLDHVVTDLGLVNQTEAPR